MVQDSAPGSDTGQVFVCVKGGAGSLMVASTFCTSLFVTVMVHFP